MWAERRPLLLMQILKEPTGLLHELAGLLKHELDILRSNQEFNPVVALDPLVESIKQPSVQLRGEEGVLAKCSPKAACTPECLLNRSSFSQSNACAQ